MSHCRIVTDGKISSVVVVAYHLRFYPERYIVSCKSYLSNVARQHGNILPSLIMQSGLKTIYSFFYSECILAVITNVCFRHTKFKSVGVIVRKKTPYCLDAIVNLMNYITNCWRAFRKTVYHIYQERHTYPVDHITKRYLNFYTEQN